jgi:hypothetical protein
MILLLVAAFVTANAPQWIKDGRQPPTQEVAAQAKQCGTQPAEVVYESDLQEEVVRFPADAVFTSQQIACLAKVKFATGYEIEVPQVFLAALYREEEALSRPWSKDLARHWLTENGLIEGLPQIDPASRDDTAYAKRLEEHCGPDAKGALSSGYGPHAVDPDLVLRFRDFERSGRVLMCLIDSATLADFDLGLIGNEKVAETSPSG